MSVPDWFRARVIPMAAEDAGVPCPSFPPFSRKGASQAIQDAARVAGMTTEKFVQMAAELFLSEKTVETHLRNIFRKMNVSSRVELAVAIERADHAHDSQH